MKTLLPRASGPAALALVLTCAAAASGRAQAARADSTHPPYNAADVYFMTGMIAHHAQAVLIAGWAPGHDAGTSVRALCERIVVGQRDEIVFMQRWLRERGLPVPDASGAMPGMAGMDHPMMMPGMLTPPQLAQLDSARGPEFDRLFLTFMIQHHEGAIRMVSDLLAVNGSTMDDVIFKYSSDVNVDQTTEIDRMNRMLAAMPAAK